MELSTPTFFVVMLIAVFPLFQLQKSANAYTEYETCSRPFQCGSINTTGYPFYDGYDRPEYCGYPGFRINCSSLIPEISVTSSESYYVVGINPVIPVITVAREDYWNGYCPPNGLSNTTINVTLFEYYAPNSANLTLFYECLDTSYPRNQFQCGNISREAPVGYFVANMTSALEDGIPVDKCKSNVIVPFTNDQSYPDDITDTVSLMEAFRHGFALEWKAENSLCDACTQSGGVCGHNTTTHNFTCYCFDRPYDHKCPGSAEKDAKKARIAGSILLAFFLAIGGGIIVAIVFYFKRRYPSTNKDIEAFLKTYRYATPKRYTYNDLKKITSSFEKRLGEGGYGVVYKGDLPNGNPVAVKILKKSKGNAEEFINEVASIGRTNHVNIVKLLGFCVEGHKRALLYDFMPNGSLDRFIYDGGSNERSLSLEDLFPIAVGIARGLEYLHQGCNTRILHFDIKPHNILLDESFCPKISDFGLAKPCLQKDSIISMSGARGTIGYIAPEVFLRNFGGVSYKSDVYSYGMLVLEMLGCRRNGKARAECSSAQYFPQWIYNQLEQGEELNDEGEGMMNGKERELHKKMVVVSLWCIQTNPSSRPSMTTVVDMLEETIESLQIPPMPSLATPPRSQRNSSTTLKISTSATPPLSMNPIQEASMDIKTSHLP